MANCNAKTKNGQACKAAAQKNSRYCFTHDPATRAQQAKARKAGGLARHTPHFADQDTLPANVATLEEARGILSYTLAEVIGMDNSIARARVLIALFDSFVKSIEIGEIEARLQALEQRTK
jgi:hypothetical protein